MLRCFAQLAARLRENDQSAHPGPSSSASIKDAHEETFTSVVFPHSVHAADIHCSCSSDAVLSTMLLDVGRV
jgi:hypothetical protein